MRYEVLCCWIRKARERRENMGWRGAEEYYEGGN
jgi:hypothetical protein